MFFRSLPLLVYHLIYRYYHEINFIKNNILLYGYIDDKILIYLNDNLSMSLPLPFLNNLENSIKNLTNSTIIYMDVNIAIKHNSILISNILVKTKDISLNVHQISFTNYNTCCDISVLRSFLLNYISFLILNLGSEI